MLARLPGGFLLPATLSRDVKSAFFFLNGTRMNEPDELQPMIFRATRKGSYFNENVEAMYVLTFRPPAITLLIVANVISKNF